MRLRMFAFVALLLIALVGAFPLALAISAMGLSGPLFTARAATGTIWDGKLRDISIDGVSLGDFSAQLSPWRLLTGTAATDLRYLVDPGTRATLVATPTRFGVEKATITLAIPGAFDPLPVDSVSLTGASVYFSGNRCADADGQVRVRLNGDIGGYRLGQELTGTPRCDGDVLQLALASSSAMERVIMRVAPTGQYNAKLIIKPADAQADAKLTSAGFAETQGGRVIEISGKF